MKTTEFNKQLTSYKLRENLQKQFGTSVNLDKYTREELEDIRNKLRTKVFQQESAAGINDLLTNETYQKDKAMLQLLNTRIKEMLGEDIAKLRDKLAQIDEAKKGVRAPKYTKKAKGSAAGADKDGDGKKDFDDIQVARMTAGGVPKKKAIAKATSDQFKEDTDKETHDYYFGKDKPKSGVGKSKELSKHTATTTGSGTKYTKRDLPGQDTADDADEKARKRKEKKMKESEDKCNHTAKGKKCPVHGMKECSMEEGVAEGSRVKEPSGNYRDPHTGRLYSSPDGKDGNDGYRTPEYMLDFYKRKLAQIAAGPYKRTKEVAQLKAMIAKLEKQGVEEGESHQAKTTMKHVKDPTPGEKAAAKDIKPGVKGFKDRYDLLKSAQRDGRLKESQEIFKRHVRIVNESLAYLLSEDEEGKAKAITAAGDMVNDYTSWMQRVGQYQTKSMIELADAIRADFGQAEAEAFKQAVGPALSATLEVLTQQREAISNAVAVLAGEATPMEPMGMEPMGMEPGMDMSEPDMMNEPTGDEFGAADAAAGGPEAAGREMRESKFQRKLAESHSIMAKLSR